MIKYMMDIPAKVEIGKGLRIEHIGGIVINSEAKLGENITLLNGVLIGAQNRGNKKGFPTIGNYVWIGENVWIDNLVEVSIGDNVCISQGAMLLCGNHNYKKATFDLMVGKIMIEEGAWVGAQSVVCPNVTIHSHAVLAVGSVASHHLEGYAVYQGNPAIKVRERNIQ